MRFNPLAQAMVMLCAMSGAAFAAVSASTDTLPDLPLPSALSASPDTAPLPVNASNQNVSSTLSFGDMGASGGMTLSGRQLQNGVSFTLPSDMVITDAQISLNVQVNHADVSGENLQLMLNGQPLGAIPLDQMQQEKGAWRLDVPASMITSTNNLSFQLKTGDDIINNTWSCQRSLPADYQVTLLPESTLSYQGLWLNVRKLLSLFPRPFFDSKQTKDQGVSVAYSAAPDADVLTASGIVASQFGVLTTGKPGRFDVQYNALPEGNGILFGKPGDRIGSVILDDRGGPSLQMIDNPNNPAYKLLIVSGRNEAELRQAAWRLTQPGLPESDFLAVSPVKITPRAAYDAPRWLNATRPVALRTLVPDEGALVARGVWHGENALPFRTAPDLFMWDGTSVPLRVNYSFAQKSWIDDQNSYLNINLNGEFLKRLPVSKEGMFAPVMAMLGLSQRQQSAIVNIDPRAILGSNQLAFYFGMTTLKNAPCNALGDDNLQSRIDGSSTLDFSGARHFGQLPNLAWFTGTLFPFTRYADLAHTALVMSAHPTAQDTTVMLTLLAQSGRDTGSTANYLHLYTGVPQQESAQQQLTESDVLAIGSLKQSDLLSPLLQNSDFSLNETTLEARTASVVSRLLTLITEGRARNDIDAASWLSDNSQWRGLVSVRSPWNPQRVVVLVTGTDDHQLMQLPTDMLKPAFYSTASGDLTTVTDGGDVRSWRVGDTFTLGDMPGYLKVLWFASQHIVFLIALACLVAAIASPLLFNALKRHAKQRLQDKTHHD
nr:cellulose biosynthesis cyclic di-GMP-binding regulatory protein BcsB [uncultured Enterobacter sp.]